MPSIRPGNADAWPKRAPYLPMNQDSLHKPLCRTRAPRMPNIDSRFTQPIFAVIPAPLECRTIFRSLFSTSVTNHACRGLQSERRTWRIRRTF